MNALPEFRPFQKLPRLSRDMVVTEKLDGTNAQILVELIGPAHHAYCFNVVESAYAVLDNNVYRLTAGSRNRWITPQSDNYGFAKWVHANADELVKLGPGSHFGEWWGNGIQRGYGLKEKRFSLFNVHRWGSPLNTGAVSLDTTCVEAPVCHVVPVLLRRTFDTIKIDDALTLLAESGSVAAPGFMNPEGVVVFHAASGQIFKKTLDKNDNHKGV